MLSIRIFIHIYAFKHDSSLPIAFLSWFIIYYLLFILLFCILDVSLHKPLLIISTSISSRFIIFPILYLLDLVLTNQIALISVSGDIAIVSQFYIRVNIPLEHSSVFCWLSQYIAGLLQKSTKGSLQLSQIFWHTWSKNIQ